VGQEWKRWEEHFSIKRDRVLEEIDALLSTGDPDVVLRYLRRHPPYKFCFLHELVCCLRDRDKTMQGKRLVSDEWRDVALYIYIDWYLHELACECWSCRPDRGVPIARVLLQRIENRSDQHCRVVMIDTAVPFRRPLRKDPCRPIPADALDLAPWLWQPVSYATAGLRAVGVRLTPQSLATHDVPTYLKGGRLWLDPEQQVLDAVYFKDRFGCERIVAFR
jgi:hypothetical protein